LCHRIVNENAVVKKEKELYKKYGKHLYKFSFIQPLMLGGKREKYYLHLFISPYFNIMQCA